ncbi:enterotoxin A family protein, partial [Bacillus cereus]|uniref:enterotoxin A family protein n=1 Tax=Bacillus cereus TaxID=1396 RepID=UPI001C54CCE4
MLNIINVKFKKIFTTLILMLLIGGSVFPNLNIAHAQNNPDKTNGVQAATLEWIRNTALDIVSLYIARSWRTDLNTSEPRWRPQEVVDTDGRTRSDTRQRLIRWDRRPPNEIFRDGFIPQVTSENPTLEDTDLYNYAKSNHKSFFVSTTKTQLKKKNYVWTPRSATTGIIYQYEIYAPGGLDVNESLSNESPWPNQMEVAFPGGIRPEFIRSVREMSNGRVQRVWINPNFMDPGGLPEIATRSSTPQVMWYNDHPNGNNRDPQVKRTFNPDEDMDGDNGSVIEDTFINEDGNKNIIPDGEYQIKSSIDQNVIVDLSENKSGASVYAYQNYKYEHQRWKFT